MKTQTENNKADLSKDLNEAIKNLLIDLLIKYPKIKRKEIIKELYNQTYFLNRYQEDIFKQK